MKKTLLCFLLAIIIGVCYGRFLFKQYDRKLDTVFDKTSIIYVLQQGVYSSLTNVEQNTKNLDYYIIEKDEPYFRVYVGITQAEKSIAKIKEIFLEKGNNIYVRELTNNNETFLTVLKQYDLLLETVTEAEQIKQIQKQVLAKYEELVMINE